MAKTDDRVKFFQEISALIIQLESEHMEFMPTCFFRTQSEQAVLYAQGKSKTLNSKHTEWLAIDFVLIRYGKPIWGDCREYQKAGELWKSMGHTWGGDWDSLGDIYHFEF
jgi:hypothetical protein